MVIIVVKLVALDEKGGRGIILVRFVFSLACQIFFERMK